MDTENTQNKAGMPQFLVGTDNALIGHGNVCAEQLVEVTSVGIACSCHSSDIFLTGA